MNKSKYQNRMKVFFILVSLSIVVVASYLYTVEKRKIHLSNMVTYHNKMIKSGSISSLVTLGKMYEKGEGVEKNLSKAQELFKKAINFNQYIDEIYPSYSKGESNKNKLNSKQKNDTQTKYSHFSEPATRKSQLNNIISKVKKSEQKSNKILKTKSAIVKLSPKYVPYIKSEKNIKRQKLVKKRRAPKKILIKNQLNKKLNIKKTALIRNEPIKRSAVKLIENSQKKTASSKPVKSSKYLTKLKPVKNTYKKSVTIKKQPSKVKVKTIRLEAKRSPSLYEERSDYETSLGSINDEIDEGDDENITINQKDEKKQQTVENNFASNPCSSASAKYIAKCRRVNRNK